MIPGAASSNTPQSPPQAPRRVVHCCDAIAWLEQSHVQEGISVITSLPDVSELAPLSLNEWKSWFVKAAKLVLSRCSDNGVAVFFQTDIKVQGVWVDKAFLVQTAAEQTGHQLLWHKVVCRVPPGKVTFSRPSYHHMLCFSKLIRADDLSKSTADVLPEAGDTTWARGMGVSACVAACKFILSHTATRTVLDPFCGHGTVLAVANALGLNAIGVEVSANRVKQAENLTLSGVSLHRGHNKQDHLCKQQQKQQQKQKQDDGQTPSPQHLQQEQLSQ